MFSSMFPLLFSRFDHKLRYAQVVELFWAVQEHLSIYLVLWCRVLFAWKCIKIIFYIYIFIFDMSTSKSFKSSKTHQFNDFSCQMPFKTHTNTCWNAMSNNLLTTSISISHNIMCLSIKKKQWACHKGE